MIGRSGDVDEALLAPLCHTNLTLLLFLDMPKQVDLKSINSYKSIQLQAQATGCPAGLSHQFPAADPPRPRFVLTKTAALLLLLLLLLQSLV